MVTCEGMNLSSLNRESHASLQLLAVKGRILTLADERVPCRCPLRKRIEDTDVRPPTDGERPGVEPQGAGGAAGEPRHGLDEGQLADPDYAQQQRQCKLEPG